MPTKEELENAYLLIFNNEKAIAEELIQVVEGFKTSLESLSAGLPSNTTLTSPIISVINQIKTSITMNYGYNLETIKSSYGLNTGTTSSIPVPLTPPPPTDQNVVSGSASTSYVEASNA